MEDQDHEEANIVPTQVKFVRMVTGEDLITEITEVESDNPDVEPYYVFHNPLKIIYATGRAPNILAVHFMQWVFSHVCPDQTFVVYPHEVMTIGNPKNDLVEYYHNCIESFAAREREALMDMEGDEGELPPEVKESITNLFDNLKTVNKRKLH